MRVAAHVSNRSLTAWGRDASTACQVREGIRADRAWVRRNNRLLRLRPPECGDDRDDAQDAEVAPRRRVRLRPRGPRSPPRLPSRTVQARAVGAPLRSSAGGGRTPPLPQDMAVALPVASPWSLPPLILVHAHLGGGSRARLGAQVLQSPHLAISPVARAAITRKRVDPGLLRLLLRARPTGTPMLVFAVSGQDARLQETTLWMTRRVLRGFHELPSDAAARAPAPDAGSGREGRSRRARRGRSRGRCRRWSRSTGRPATGTASTGASSPRSTASRPATAATSRPPRRARSAGCSSCRAPGAAGASMRPATASPIR